MAKILVVDDAQFMRMMMRNILTGVGHEVVGEAENGLEAVEKYSELEPELTMMDIVMPEMEGVEALRKILESHDDARILMCSATGQETLIDQAMKAGAKGFITKPFEEDDVIAAINKVLES